MSSSKKYHSRFYTDEAAIDEYCRIGSIFDLEKKEEEGARVNPRPGFSGPYKPDAMQYGSLRKGEGRSSAHVTFVSASTS